MFKNIFCSFYLVKGKVVELELSASAPEKEEKSKKTFQELDAELQAHYDKISVLLPKLKEFKKIEKNSVYFVTVETDYLERGEFKGEVVIMSKNDLSPAEFKKLDKKLKAEDKKILESNKNMDEADNE